MTPVEQAEATRQVILRMEAALGDNANDMETHFHDDFRWMGNAGCGYKEGLLEFQQAWQNPLKLCCYGDNRQTK